MASIIFISSVKHCVHIVVNIFSMWNVCFAQDKLGYATYRILREWIKIVRRNMVIYSQ